MSALKVDTTALRKQQPLTIFVPVKALFRDLVS